jgi:hypothetical protein
MSGFVAESGWRHPGLGSALRERGGQRDKGTQGTRKLSTMDVVEAWRKGRHHTCPSREPCAVKVACTVLTGGCDVKSFQ